MRGWGGILEPLKNHKAIGFISNAGPDFLEKHKATKPAFNVWSSSACQRNAIYMAFRWWADEGPLLGIFGSSDPSSTIKRRKKRKAKKVIRIELDPL